MSNPMNMEEFAAESGKGVVLVDFWATWCGPCKMLMPVIEQIEKELTDVKFIKLDVDENQEIASHFGVRTIPALFVLKNGEVVEQFTGIQDKAKIVNALKNA